jgi:hypothetical protein
METRITYSATTPPADAGPDQQHVFSARSGAAMFYDRTSADGSSSSSSSSSSSAPAIERLYLLPDAAGNTTSLADSSGTVVERYQFDAFGAVTFLDADGTPRDPNASAYEAAALMVGVFYDSDTALYTRGQPVLHPPLGRFVARRGAATPQPPFGGVEFEELQDYKKRYHFDWVTGDPLAPPWPFTPLPKTRPKQVPKEVPPPAPLPAPLPAKPKPRCGVEIGPALSKGLDEFRTKFLSRTSASLYDICLGGSGTWDITELANKSASLKDAENGCGLEPCGNTVTVYGTCYDAVVVNYVFWGAITRACGWPLITSLAAVAAYRTAQKVYQGWELGIPCRQLWTVLGYYGVFRRSDVPAPGLRKALTPPFPTEYNDAAAAAAVLAASADCAKPCSPCPTEYKRSLTFRVSGLFGGEPYEIPERKPK